MGPLKLAMRRLVPPSYRLVPPSHPLTHCTHTLHSPRPLPGKGVAEPLVMMAARLWHLYAYTSAAFCASPRGR